MREVGPERFSRDWRRALLPADLSRCSGIYRWEIAGVGSYVGKSRNLARRLREYPNNIRKLMLGLPYRKGKPDGFRGIHRELARALDRGASIQCSVIELCPSEQLSDRETHWIEQHGTLNGKPLRGEGSGPNRP